MAKGVVGKKPTKVLSPSKVKVIVDPAQSLQTFDLLDLQQYTREKVYATTASKDFHLFYFGRDDVVDILKHVLSRVTVSLYLNVCSYDDEELNDILMRIAHDPTITMLVTLDKSQDGGKQGKALLDADKVAGFNTHVAIAGRAGGPDLNAQNTLSIITDPDTISRFSAELVAEHMIARKQSAATIGQSATHQISHTKGFVADGKVAGVGGSIGWSASGEGQFIVQNEDYKPPKK